MDISVLDQARIGRRGPVEGDHLIGFDLDPTRRPGVPMRAAPARAEGVPPAAPAEQPGRDQRSHRAGLDRATPVFGTAQPLHGAGGALRRRAYRIPEYHARHWVLLMAADRVDVLEGRVGAGLAAPFRTLGAGGIARRIESNPLPALLALSVLGSIAALRLAGRLRHGS